MSKSCPRANKECTDILLDSCYGSTEWTALCDGKSLIKPWTSERHRHEKRQMNPAIHQWKPWNHDSADGGTQSGSREKSSCGLSADVWPLRLGDADRFSVSGTASWLRGKLGWYPIIASNRKQSTIALSSGEAELVAALSSGIGHDSSDAMTRSRLKSHNRSCAVIPLRR